MPPFSSPLQQTRVLLINPPFPRPTLRGAPLSQLYLAGSLRHPSLAFQGECRILDLNGSTDTAGDLRRSLGEFEPTHVGITRYSPNAKVAMDILRQVKAAAPAIRTMTGGPHEVFCGQNTFRQFGPGGEGIVDFVVPDFDGIRGFHRVLGMDSGLGLFDITPAHDMLAHHPKYQFDGLFEGRMTQLMTSTGCPFTCAFCHHDTYRKMPAERVIPIVRNILQLGFRAVVFDDLNFVTDRRRTEVLLREFRSMDFEWGCQTRADSVDADLLGQMARAGCTYICYGMETGDDNALESPELAKRMRFSTLQKTVGNTQAMGIRVGLFVMFGHPAEMERPSIAGATLDAIEALTPRFLSISFYAMYPSFSSPPGLISGYEKGAFSQEQGWLQWDEGWGAHHPACDLAYAQSIEAQIQECIRRNPGVWNSIRRF